MNGQRFIKYLISYLGHFFRIDRTQARLSKRVYRPIHHVTKSPNHLRTQSLWFHKKSLVDFVYVVDQRWFYCFGTYFPSCDFFRLSLLIKAGSQFIENELSSEAAMGGGSFLRVDEPLKTKARSPRAPSARPEPINQIKYGNYSTQKKKYFPSDVIEPKAVNETRDR